MSLSSSKQIGHPRFVCLFACLFNGEKSAGDHT